MPAAKTLNADGTLTCNECGQALSLSAYTRSSRAALGVMYTCRDCWRARSQAFYARNPEKHREYGERKRSKPGIREREARRMAEWRRNHPEELRERIRKGHLKKYGLTIEQYEGQLASQDGRCAICRREPGRMRLHVDHCHESGAIRGLLCGPCNSILGMAKDDAAILLAAVAYLRR